MYIIIFHCSNTSILYIYILSIYYLFIFYFWSIHYISIVNLLSTYYLPIIYPWYKLCLSTIYLCIYIYTTCPFNFLSSLCYLSNIYLLYLYQVTNKIWFQGQSLADWALDEDGQLNLRSIILIGNSLPFKKFNLLKKSLHMH